MQLYPYRYSGSLSLFLAQTLALYSVPIPDTVPAPIPIPGLTRCMALHGAHIVGKQPSLQN